MVAVTADPTRELTLYFRINRDGVIVFSFLDLNGIALDLSPYTIVVNFKYRKSDSSNFLQITPTISGNTAILILTKSQSAAFREQTFFWELVRTKSGLEKNWLTGDAIFHQGKFDGVTNSGQIFINSFDDMVQITVNETSGESGAVIFKGDYDASTNLFPSPSFGGYQYRISVAGILGGRSVDVGAMIEKLEGDDQLLSSWDIDD